MLDNVAAQDFWRRITAVVAEGSVVELGVEQGWWQGVVQQFNVPAAA